MVAFDISDRIANRQSFIVANDGQFLGILSLSKFSIESIFNRFGNFGSKYSTTSIFNKFSNYGSPYSSLSPYNKFSNTPPVIYLRGVRYGYLTKNKFLGFNSIDPDNLVDWLDQNNLKF